MTDDDDKTAKKCSYVCPSRPGFKQWSLCFMGASKHVQEIPIRLLGTTAISILDLE